MISDAQNPIKSTVWNVNVLLGFTLSEVQSLIKYEHIQCNQIPPFQIENFTLLYSMFQG